MAKKLKTKNSKLKTATDFLPEGYELPDGAKTDELPTSNVERPTLNEAAASQGVNKSEGLECKKCGCNHFYVGRTVTRGKKIYRYRYCRHCGKGITTEEREIGCN